MTQLNFPNGSLFFDPRANQRIPFAQLGFTSTTSPTAYISVYSDAALSMLWTQPIQADANGNFPPNIYLDPYTTSPTVYVTLYQPISAGGAQIWQSKWGVPLTMTPDSLCLQWMSTAVIGEVTIPASATSELIVYPLAGAVGLRLVGGGQVGGVASPAIKIANGTTGAQTATFTATNKPGNFTSGPVKWLPVLVGSTTYYAPCFL
jgi:hypothetical protein